MIGMIIHAYSMFFVAYTMCDTNDINNINRKTCFTLLIIKVNEDVKLYKISLSHHDSHHDPKVNPPKSCLSEASAKPSGNSVVIKPGRKNKGFGYRVFTPEI